MRDNTLYAFVMHTQYARAFIGQHGDIGAVGSSSQLAHAYLTVVKPMFTRPSE
jgi:hypothetical protein